MNVNKLNELCDKFVILIDKNSNNLTSGVSEINHPKIMIHLPGQTYSFKLVRMKQNVYQIQCLSSYKILTVLENGNVFFDEYFQLKNLNASLFFVVYDSISISLFPLIKPNTVLIFNEGLSIKSINDTFANDDQTIFEYESLDYSSLQVLAVQPAPFPSINVIKISSVKDLFYNILNIYNKPPSQLMVCLANDALFPLDYYIENENWMFIDRYFSLNNLKTYKRKLENKDLILTEMIPMSSDNWLEIDPIINMIPKLSSTQMIWQKIIKAEFNLPVYFSTLSTFIIQGDIIKKRSFKYYNDIHLLLERTTDEKIHNLIRFSLYTIFFCVENSE